MWGLRAPTRCITVPQGAIENSNQGGRLKLSVARRNRAGLVALVLPTITFAGSQTYSSPGSYAFTVPAYGSLTVQVWGAGGGGGGGSSSWNPVSGNAGGQSYFTGSVVAGGGGGGSSGHPTVPSLNVPGGAGGVASAGRQATVGTVEAREELERKRPRGLVVMVQMAAAAGCRTSSVAGRFRRRRRWRSTME